MVLNFETEIEVLLFDQSKIVTYKELGNKFKLTPFQARKELNKFIACKRDSSDEKSKFFTTYLIIGEDKQTEIKRVFLANETDLEKTKSEFNILSKQIYSIQSNEVNEFDVIYASDLDASNNLSRKSNLTISSKLKEPKKMDVDDDDEMMMNMIIPTETKPIKSKKDDQENKPVIKPVVKKEVEVKKESVTKHMDQISKDISKEKDVPEAKKQKLTENNSANAQQASKPASKPAAAPAKGKKNIEPAKNQKTMMSFFKKKV